MTKKRADLAIGAGMTIALSVAKHFIEGSIILFVHFQELFVIQKSILEGFGEGVEFAVTVDVQIILLHPREGDSVYGFCGTLNNAAAIGRNRSYVNVIKDALEHYADTFIFPGYISKFITVECIKFFLDL